MAHCRRHHRLLPLLLPQVPFDTCSRGDELHVAHGTLDMKNDVRLLVEMDPGYPELALARHLNFLDVHHLRWHGPELLVLVLVLVLVLLLAQGEPNPQEPACS